MKTISSQNKFLSFSGLRTTNNRQLKCLLWGILICMSGVLMAQPQALIHSHNDYRQRVPFYQAYAQQVNSIEADIFAGKNKNELLVAHDAEELPAAPTFDELYLNPIVQLFRKNNGRAWKDSDKTLYLLVDLKTATSPTLDRLVAKLKPYPQVFDPSVNPYAVKVVVTGNTPKPSDFSRYPSYIFFDGRITESYSTAQLERIAMISASFRDLSEWNGKGSMIGAEKKQVEDVIRQVHALGKPVRFWAAPDYVTAWNTFYFMGVDFINTDRVEACSDYFRNFNNKNYQIAGLSADGLTRTNRLDKTTAGFRGFDNKKLQLSKGIEVYQPSYKNDGAKTPVRNVIFLIGDGMGLAQICAAETVNKGLTMLHMRYVGLQKNSAKDAYTTDSAAAGSALATGVSNCNRHISMSETGEPYPSMTDIFHAQGYSCGVVTLGNLADATPAAFYGHSVERDDSDEITRYLLDGKLTLLAGSGMDVFTKRKDDPNFLVRLKEQYQVVTSVAEINKDKKPVICVDERMGAAASEESLSLLADATGEAIRKLQQASDKGFFLMVEGAKIDYAGHANSLPGSVVETLSFDLAVAAATKFADSNGETLVIVTADHETGGLTLIDGDREQGHITARYVTDDHTPLMLPVFVYGPGATAFTGVYQNTEIFHRLKKLMSL